MRAIAITVALAGCTQPSDNAQPDAATPMPDAPATPPPT
jgi:hypothetical protein